MTTFLSPKDIRQWDTFDGSEANWQGWAFATTAALSDLGWGAYPDAAKRERNPIDPATFGPIVPQVSANLYSLLAQKTRGKAQTIVRLMEFSRNGLETWRQLWEEYSPHGHEPSHALLSAIIQPKWWHSQEHRNRPFVDVLIDWEQLIAKYIDTSGEPVTNGTMCATVLGWAA